MNEKVMMSKLTNSLDECIHSGAAEQGCHGEQYVISHIEGL
jgi:hypothetical protein